MSQSSDHIVFTSLKSLQSITSHFWAIGWLGRSLSCPDLNSPISFLASAKSCQHLRQMAAPFGLAEVRSQILALLILLTSTLFYHIVDQLSSVHPLSKGGGAFQTGIIKYVDMPNIVHLLTTSRKKTYLSIEWYIVKILGLILWLMTWKMLSISLKPP